MTRLLFVSSVVDGGSPRSQRALAHALVERGHEIGFLVDDQRSAPLSRLVGEKLADASVRFANSGAIQAMARRPGAQPETREIEDLVHFATPHPHNALLHVIAEFAPDVVVGNSIDRHCWRRILEICQSENIATILYLREVPALGHLEITPRPADALVANAVTLVDQVRAQGHACEFIPSLIDTSKTQTTSTRTSALLINPIPSHGLELALAVAARCPSIPFVFQESWPLDATDWDSLSQRVATLPNVELRRRREPGPELYESARVLLVPHRIDNRPRVIIEAQANAIPAIISRYPGLQEAAGMGAIALPQNDFTGWTSALTELWENEGAYNSLANAARQASQRRELNPTVVVESFEQLFENTVASVRSR